MGKKNAYLNAETPANTNTGQTQRPVPNLDPRPPKPDNIILQGPNGPVILPVVALGHIPTPMAQYLHQLVNGAVKAAFAEVFATALGLHMFPQQQANSMARDANRFVALKNQLLDEKNNADPLAIITALKDEIEMERESEAKAAAAAQAAMDEAVKAAGGA